MWHSGITPVCSLCSLPAFYFTDGQALAHIFKKFFVFELQWILLVFVFWPHQKTSFEASERNKGASHAPTALKLTLGTFHTTCEAAFLAHASLNWFFKTKQGDEERGEREKKKKEGGREEKGRRGASKQLPWMARVQRVHMSFAHMLSAAREPGSFLFFSHDSST